MSFLSPRTNAAQNSKLLGFRTQTSVYGKAIVRAWGRNRISPNLIWLGNWQAHAVKQGGKGGKGSGGKGGGGSYTYTASIMLALCSGVVSAVVRGWQDRTEIQGNPLAATGMTLFGGAVGQAAWGYLATNFADQALGYSGTAYLAKQDADLGTAGTISNYGFELDLPRQFGGGIVDVDPKWVITDVLSAIGFPSGSIGDLTELSAWCVANGLFLSPVLDAQVTADQFLGDLLTAVNCVVIQSEAQLKFRSYGDTSVTGNGVTFTPNTTPIYSLTDDDLISDSDDPVKAMRPTVRDAYSAVSVEWTNRANAYSTETLSEQDDAAIDQFGFRPASPIQGNGITTLPVAQKIANMALKTSVYKRATYSFKLLQKYILAEPADLINVLDSRVFGGNRTMRILSIEEGEDYTLTVTAEEYTGTANPGTHGKQPTGGYTPGFGAAPGDINAPVMFQPPLAFNNGVELSLRIGLSGGPDWGGCSVWVSTDGGASYTKIGTQRGASTMGTLTADLPVGVDPDVTNTLAVDLTESFGALDTVTTAQADALLDPFVVELEMMAFRTAAISTNPYAYNVTYLRRGAYGTTIAAHLTGTAFCLIDDQMYLYKFAVADIGQVRKFKFTSFNKAGQNEQDIADVTAYPFTLGTQRLPTGGGYDKELTPPTTFTPSLAKGNVFDLTLAASTAYTIEAPTGGGNAGDVITFILRFLGSGTTVAWHADYLDVREAENISGAIYRTRFVRQDDGKWLFLGEVPSL